MREKNNQRTEIFMNATFVQRGEEDDAPKCIQQNNSQSQKS